MIKRQFKLTKFRSSRLGKEQDATHDAVCAVKFVDGASKTHRVDTPNPSAASSKPVAVWDSTDSWRSIA